MGTSGWLDLSRQAFGGAVGVDLHLGSRLAVGANVWSEQPRRQELGGGEVSASAHSLGAHLRLIPWKILEAGPELTLGLRLEGLAASSRGYAEPSSLLILNPSLWGNVAWRQPLGTRFFVSPSVGVTARPHTEVIAVQHLGPVLTLPALALHGGVGLGWMVF
jgi:hypothetical protein